MINPIKAIDQKIFNEQQTHRISQSNTFSKKENGIDESSTVNSFVDKKDDVSLSYDVSRYVQILKNKLIPPEDRVDASILLEIELGGEITAQELKQMLDEVERNDLKKENTKVIFGDTDSDSGKEA
jgi:hypothetical protein